MLGRGGGERNVVSQDVSRGREDIRVSPDKGKRDTSQDGIEQRRLSAMSKDSGDKNKNKVVSFGGGNN